MTKSTWGGPRPNSGGKRAGAGRKPQTIKINVEDARAILNYSMSAELIERLGQFTRKGQTMKNIAQKLIDAKGAYNITKKDIADAGGKWNNDYMLYVFPDDSHGAYTDIRNGAQERDNNGNCVVHFAVEE